MPREAHCTVCREWKTNVQLNRTIDADVCNACYVKFFRPRRRCAICRSTELTNYFTEDGQPLCPKCYQRDIHIARCSICGDTRTIGVRRKKKVVCVNCAFRVLRREKCVGCGTRKPVMHRMLDGGAVCEHCYWTRFKESAPCSLCRRPRVVRTRLSNGDPVCEKCYLNNVNAERCAFCRRTKRVAKRTEEGQAVCASCYDAGFREREECSLCHELRQTKFRRRDGGSVCGSCYAKELRPKEACSRCGKMGTIPYRGAGGPMCQACYDVTRFRGSCTFCGKVAALKWGRRAGTPMCGVCYKHRMRPSEPCSICGRMKIVNTRRPDGGAVCDACRAREKRASSASV